MSPTRTVTGVLVRRSAKVNEAHDIARGLSHDRVGASAGTPATLTDATWKIETVVSDGDGLDEVVGDKG